MLIKLGEGENFLGRNFFVWGGSVCTYKSRKRNSGGQARQM